MLLFVIARCALKNAREFKGRIRRECTKSMDAGAGSSDVLEEGARGVTTAGKSSSSLESELENVCRELGLLEHKISQMLQQQTALCKRREQLSAEIQARKKRREFSSSKFVASRM